MTATAQSAPTSVTSFFVLDTNQVLNKLNHWRQCFPLLTPFYAVKSNPTLDLVHTLEKNGVSFDCASTGEMLLVKSLGVASNRIIFAHPCKNFYDLQVAQKLGVTKTTFDSEDELFKIHRFNKDMELVLRITVDDKSCKVPMSNKYGAPSSDWGHLLTLAKQLGMKVIGVSFHVGSGGGDLTRYRSAILDSKKVWDMATELGFSMRILDIGGGFPGTCETAADSPNPVSLKAVADIVNPLLSLFPESTEFIAEPGRYFCSESQTLATMIIGKRTKGGKLAYFVGDSLYQSFNCMIYDFGKIRLHSDVEGAQPCTVFGHTCDGADSLSKELMLPNLEVGDWLVFPAMGAYTNTASTTFNGFNQPELYVIN
jgi:ornithine decarboxylase